MSDLEKFRLAMLQRNFERAEFIAKEVGLRAPKFAEVLIAAVGFERDGEFELNVAPSEIRNENFQNITMLLIGENSLDKKEKIQFRDEYSGKKIWITPANWLSSESIYVQVLAVCYQLGLISCLNKTHARWNFHKKYRVTILHDAFLSNFCHSLIQNELYDAASNVFIHLSEYLMADLARKLSVDFYADAKHFDMNKGILSNFIHSLLKNEFFTRDRCFSFVWSFTKVGNMRLFIWDHSAHIISAFPDDVGIQSVIFRSDVHVIFDKKKIKSMDVWGSVLSDTNFNLAGRLAYHLPFISPSIAKEITWSNEIRKMWEEIYSTVDRSVPAQPLAQEHFRITFASCFFQNHGIGHALAGIVDQLKQHGFVYDAVSLGSERKDDVFQNSIRHHAEEWLHEPRNDVSSMTQVAQWVNKRRSDAIINLDGFMDPESLNLLQHNASPLNIYWIGHGGKINLPFIDYTITDKFVTKKYPENFGEKEIRLQNSFVSFLPIEFDDKLTKQDFNIPNDRFVFLCFNNPIKITKEYLICLADIAKVLNYSVVFWFNYGDSAEFVYLILKELSALGVPKSCVKFGRRLEPKSVHFSRLAVSDVALDTFHVNMASGALDCMWAGTPVVSLVGENYTSRICGSFNETIGLENFNVETREEYVAKAIQLVREPRLLWQARQHLQANKAKSPLFNGEVFTAGLCAGLKLAIERSRRGEAPKHLDVPGHVD